MRVINAVSEISEVVEVVEVGRGLHGAWLVLGAVKDLGRLGWKGRCLIMPVRV